MLGAALKSHFSRQIIDPSLIFVQAAPPSYCQQVGLFGCWHTALLPVLLSALLPQQQPALALLQAVKRQERSERSSAACCPGEDTTRSLVQQASPSPADKAGTLGAQYCSQETRVTASLPCLAKKREVVMYPSPACPIWENVTELQICCHHPVPVTTELAFCH